jgi:hypothetical protein
VAACIKHETNVAFFLQGDNMSWHFSLKTRAKAKLMLSNVNIFAPLPKSNKTVTAAPGNFGPGGRINKV